MNKRFLLKGLLVSFMLLCSAQTWAYNFTATNDDGVTIYYNITSSEDRTCEVTGRYSGSKNENTYSGNIVIPTSVMYNNTRYAVTSIGNYAFYKCSSLIEVALPNSITSINSHAFYGCSILTEVTIPNSVTSIGSQAFCDCSSLEKVTIGNSVTSIGTYAFMDCTSLETVHFNAAVSEIPSSTFWGCSSLTSIDIPNSVVTIEYGAFLNCESLKEITIPDSVTKIGDRAFEDCTSLTEVTIPNSVTSIGSQAFSYCGLLTSMKLGNSVTTIGSWAFDGCGLTGELKIPDSVTTIGSGAFERCTGMRSIILGTSLTSIDYMAFYYTGLKYIYSLNPEPPECIDSSGYGYKVFEGIDKDACMLYVPIGSYSAYATANEWEEFLNIVEMDMTGIESISSDDAEIIGYYTIDGKVVDAPQRGINIVKYSDGSTKKVLVK